MLSNPVKFCLNIIKMLSKKITKCCLIPKMKIIFEEIEQNFYEEMILTEVCVYRYILGNKITRGIHIVDISDIPLNLFIFIFTAESFLDDE